MEVIKKSEKVTDDTSSLNSCEKYTYFCRLCAKFNLSSDGIRIEDKQSKVLRKISTCLPIIVEKNDNLPKMICSNCSNSLDSFYDFYKSTIHADKKLNHFFNTQLIDETNPTKEISQKSDKTPCLYCKVNVLNYDKHLKKYHKKQLSVQIYSLQTKESVFSRKILAIIKNQSRRIKKKGKSAVKRQCTKCPFCQKIVFKFTRHLLLSHRNKEEVKIFLEYPKQDKATISDFIKSLQEKIVFEPEITIKTEPLDSDESFEYLPTKKAVTCQKCSGIYSSRALNFHQRKCKGIKKCKTEIIDGNNKTNEILPSNKRKLGESSRNPFSSTEDMINKECEKYLENYEEHLKCSTIQTNVATSYKTAENITLMETNLRENIEKVIEPKKRGRKPKPKDPNSVSAPLNLTNKTTASVSHFNCENEATKLFTLTDSSVKRIKTDGGGIQREDLNVDPTKCGAILNIPQRKCRESVEGRFSYFHNTDSLTSGILERKNFNSRKSIEDFRQLMIDHFLSLDDEPDLSPELDQDDNDGQPRRTYSVKRTWTDEEKSVMIKHFNSYIQSKTLPSFHLCGVVRDANPVLFGRTNSVMKAWVYNQYKKLK